MTGAGSPLAAHLALVLGSLLLVGTCYAALRPGGRGVGFGWAVVNGLGFTLLAMAAALRLESSGGLHAAGLLFLTVVLAAGLGAASMVAGETPRIAAVGRGVAWAALIGLPPTLGFHAKLALYSALLTAGWGWSVLPAMAASLALLGPALGEMRSAQPAEIRGPRAVSIVALIGLLILLGLSPYLWIGLGPGLGDVAGTP